jgi:hypothetical protein
MNSRQLATEAVDVAVNAIATKIEALIALVNTKPVYTIHEMLEEREISPQKIIVIGGPASSIQGLAAPTRLGMDVVVPPSVRSGQRHRCGPDPHHQPPDPDRRHCQGKVSAPMLGIFRSIPRGYTL